MRTNFLKVLPVLICACRNLFKSGFCLEYFVSIHRLCRGARRFLVAIISLSLSYPRRPPSLFPLHKPSHSHPIIKRSGTPKTWREVLPLPPLHPPSHPPTHSTPTNNTLIKICSVYIIRNCYAINYKVKYRRQGKTGASRGGGWGRNFCRKKV